MDHESFDRLARAMGAVGSRRLAVGALLGAGWAGALGVAARKGRNKKRKGGKKGRGTAQVSAQAADCLSPGPSSNMNGCNFVGEDFDGRDLSGSSMVATSFRSASLVDADLSSSNLKGADFRGADLCSADLSSSTLRNADFRGIVGPGGETNLFRADLSSSSCGGIQTNARTLFCRTRTCNGSISDRDCPDGVAPENVCCVDADCGGAPCVDGVCANCGQVTITQGPPTQATFRVQRAAGVVELLVTRSENADTVVPPFIPGTTDPIVITATKIDQTKQAVVEFRVTEGPGNTSVCRLTF